MINIHTYTNKQKFKHKGFTIVELIIVMAIIAILTLIAVPTYTKFIKNAEQTKEAANADICYTAAYSVMLEEYYNPTATYKTPAYDSSNNGLKEDSALYQNIVELANIPGENVEVYTVKKGNSLNDFNYEHVDTENYSDQFVDEWSIILPIDGDTNASIDLTGDIYIVPPALREERFVYKNGVNTNTLLRYYEVE